MPNTGPQLSRPPLERMLRIHDELRRGALVNCSHLVRALEVSRKTIVRDIAFMRSNEHSRERVGAWNTDGLAGPALALVEGDRDAPTLPERGGV